MPEITYDGPEDPADRSGEVLVEAGDERATLRKGQPTEVSAAVAKAAESMEGHKFSKGSSKKSDDDEKPDEPKESQR